MDRITLEMCQNIPELLDNDLMALGVRLWSGLDRMSKSQMAQAEYYSKLVAAEGKKRGIKIKFSVKKQ